MQLDENQKIQILLAELQERYSASHKIRERSVQFTLWISGMAIGLGWLLIKENSLVLYQRIALTLLILALFAGTLYFIMGLRRGFRKNREAMIKCERALGMYDSSVYLPDCPLLPIEYCSTKRKWSGHFYTLYIWLVLIACSLFILTWSCSHPVVERISNSTVEQTYGGKK